jgi:hypothetical protein
LEQPTAEGVKGLKAEKIIETLKGRSKQSYVPSYALSAVYIGLGDKRQALD